MNMLKFCIAKYGFYQNIRLDMIFYPVEYLHCWIYIYQNIPHDKIEDFERSLTWIHNSAFSIVG